MKQYKVATTPDGSKYLVVGLVIGEAVEILEGCTFEPISEDEALQLRLRPRLPVFGGPAIYHIERLFWVGV